MRLFTFGLSHKTAPIQVRERLAIPSHELPNAMDRLREIKGLSEVVLLATCNRFEIYGVSDSPDSLIESLTPFFESHLGISPSELGPHLYRYSEADTVLHVMRVASSLDSQIVGESQILGQVKEAFRISRERGGAGKLLSKLLQRAIEAGKRVRTETGIARIPVSVSTAAVELAEKIFGSLEGRSALVVGVGEMSETTLKHLVSAGISEVFVTNRTLVRASSLAALYGGRALPFESLEESLEIPDIVVTSTAATEPVITGEMVARAMMARRRRPLFLIDIAVPRDVAPEVSEQEDVYLYNIDDLQTIAERNYRSRMEEAVVAEKKVLECQQDFLKWHRSLASVPLITRLEERGQAIVKDEIDKLTFKLGLDKEAQAVAGQALRAVMKRVLHMQIATVKRISEEEDSQCTLELIEEAIVEFSRDIRPATSEAESGSSMENVDLRLASVVSLKATTRK